jgi:hypothetical protein
MLGFLFGQVQEGSQEEAHGARQEAAQGRKNQLLIIF